MTRDEIIGMAREAGFGVAASMPGLIEALSRLRAERDALRTELDALKAWKEEAEKKEPVAWLHETRRDSDVVTSAVKHVWGKVAVGSLAAYSIPLYLAPGAKGE